MQVECEVAVSAKNEAVWAAITDHERWTEIISGIEKVEVLEKPEDGLVGFKWRETRTMFGKTATEEMWITEAVENSYYKTRAESHGCVYESTISVREEGEGCVLKMQFSGAPQGCLAKVLMVPMGFLFKRATIKALQQDLEDIKAAVESA